MRLTSGAGLDSRGFPAQATRAEQEVQPHLPLMCGPPEVPPVSCPVSLSGNERGQLRG